ncbi:MAG: pantoate--beta-alanine ligase [Candidatus Omnitrophica bacterium]|nr:pantoate--beta-alanine ligase [Candidatus Omnitrophota bacterium]
MRKFCKPKALESFVRGLKARRKTIGFVPTMGFLHEGHLALVRRAQKENDAVVVSIFVNPLQFGPKEDYRRYPRDLRRDEAILRKAGVDCLFAPEVKALYPGSFQTEVRVRRLSTPLCGKSRPGHFAGVATVVLKLLHLVAPGRIYLGQKDYQQFKVIERLTADLNLPVKVRMCPIIRESDGLAMSSRNVTLEAPARREARVLYQALLKTGSLIRGGERDARRVQKALETALKAAHGARVDYAELVDAETLLPVVKLRQGSRVLAAVAVYFDKTRLIDNLLIRV